MSEQEFYVKLHKWADNIDNTLTEWASQSVEEYFDVEHIEQLTEEQVGQLRNWVELNSETGYDHILIGFTNIINHWEAEKYEYD